MERRVGAVGPTTRTRRLVGDEPPFLVPVFLVTHHARERETKASTPIEFVTERIEVALGCALAAAGHGTCSSRRRVDRPAGARDGARRRASRPCRAGPTPENLRRPRIPGGAVEIGQRDEDVLLREELLRVELVRRFWPPFPVDDRCGVWRMRPIRSSGSSEARDLA